jgi:predicted dehydrogenase
VSGQVRIGVVGTGHWAQVVHATGVAAHPDVELTGVWGRDLARAGELAARYQAVGFDDFDALLDVVDALTFAVPPQVQAELAVRAADAGKHLLLEKPITTDAAAADRLVDTVARAEVSTVVFFTQRFVPSWERWLDQVRGSGLLGGRAEWLTTLEPDGPYAGSLWRKEDGALWDVGPHALSVLIPALGPVVGVTGGRGPGDLVNVVLSHEGGASSVMSLSLTMPTAAGRHGVEVYDEDGWHVRPDDPRDVALAYATAMSELVGCIRAGVTQHRCDVRFGREVVEVLARCEEVLGRRA